MPWIYRGDEGGIGETYNIGGGAERRNIEIAEAVCELLDELLPDSPHAPHASLIEFVTDRPGHDRRYAMDAGKAGRELGWQPRHSFATGLRETVAWYLENRWWWEAILSGEYRLERLGLGRPAGEASAP